MLEKWGEWQRKISREVDLEVGYGKCGTLTIIESIQQINGGRTNSDPVEYGPVLVEIHNRICGLCTEDRSILIFYFVKRYPVRVISRIMQVSRRRINKRIHCLIKEFS